MDYTLKRNKENLKLDIKHLAVDKFNAKGSFDIDDLDKKDPLLKASAVTKFLLLENSNPIFPGESSIRMWRNFIEKYVKDGKFRLVEGKLNGRLSQVAHMYNKESVDVVSIRAEVKKGVLEAEETAPVFHDISGMLELKKRQFVAEEDERAFWSLTLNNGRRHFRFFKTCYLYR